MSNIADFVIEENVLAKYTGEEAVVEIPAGITEIGKNAFAGNKTMTELIMPDSVVTICESAFEKCVKLKKITFSQHLEEIKYEAFAGCKVLKEVHLPDSIRILGSAVFAGCAKLETVTCNSQVYEAGSNPFADFRQPSSKLLADENGLIIFCGVVHDVLEHKSELVIPKGVTKIANGVFRKNSWERKPPLNKVVLPDTLTYIGFGAFNGRSELEEINLFPGIDLGDNVFGGCSKLADEHGFLINDGVALAYYGDGGEVTVPEGVTELAKNLFACGYEANPGNSKIQTVHLPRSLRRIGPGAFANCKTLENIVIPETVEEIGDAAFQNCLGLTDSHMVDHVQKLGEGVFTGCKNLADENGFVIIGGAVQCFFGADREIEIPEGVTAIESGTFCKTGILSIRLPSTLRRLGSAFRECNLLESIDIPEGVTELTYEVFINCKRLKEVRLPSTLKEIHSGAFQGCEDLEQIQIPDGVTRISSRAFKGCYNLRSIRIPGGVKVLEYDAFMDCKALKEVTLCEGLEKIGPEAFSGCDSLRELHIPATVKELCYRSFSRCSTLRKLDYTGTELDVHPDAFEGCNILADGNGLLILANTLWRYIGKGGHVTVPEGVTTLANNVFREGSKGVGRGSVSFRREGLLTGVTLPSTLQKIGAGALAGCTSLTQLEIPESVTVIGAEAFENCRALQTISLPSGLAGVGAYAFRDCESLKRMVLAEGTEYISNEQFRDCKSLVEVVIPATVTHISEDAFLGCSSLLAITVHPENTVFSSEDGILYNKAGDTLLYCPGGKQLEIPPIGEKVTTIGDRAFRDCESLKRLVIPAHVANLGDGVFPRKGWGRNAVVRPIEVEIGAGSGSVGERVFDIDDWDKPLVYPKLPVTFVKEQTTQVCLGLGFCMNPDQYEDAYREIYEKYALSHQKTLVKKATAQKLGAVMDYFSKLEETGSVKAKKINYQKLSDTAKVEMLEQAILERDPKKLKTVLEGCKTFELTARALGLACHYGSPEIVRMLVEFGADFVFEVNPSLKRKYGVAYGTTYSSYKADYYLMAAKTKLNVYITTLFTDSESYHFGYLPSVRVEPIEQTQQAEIAAYLLEKNCKGFNGSAVLYYALLWGNRPVAEAMLSKGVKLPAWVETILTDASPTMWNVERNELLMTLPKLDAQSCIFALTTFAQMLCEQKILLTQKIFENSDSIFTNPQVLKCLIEITDTSKLTKTKLLETAVDKEGVEALELMVNAGWLRTAPQREKLIAYAFERKKTAALAWLMDYKNRTVDVVAEEAKKEAKIMRELMEDPNSVSALKKIWSYKKIEDGTLMITSYKGEGGDVVIPAMIGKSKVTVIGEEAFSASGYNSRVKNLEARKQITSVVIPEGVTTIGRCAFFQCESLETITIPETVHTIENVAFRYCKKLRGVKLPDNIKKLGMGIFWDCPTMYDKHGLTVVSGILLGVAGEHKEITVPEGVKRIGQEVFKINSSWDKNNSIQKITLPESLEEIGDSAFENMKNLKSIIIPAGVRTIGDRAFMGSGLEQITIATGVEMIGKEVFVKTPLTEVKLPATVKTIGDKAFQACGNLRDLYIPNGDAKLGEEILGTYDTGSAWGRPAGVYVHTPADSQVAKYMQQYSGVFVDTENLE